MKGLARPREGSVAISKTGDNPADRAGDDREVRRVRLPPERDPAGVRGAPLDPSSRAEVFPQPVSCVRRELGADEAGNGALRRRAVRTRGAGGPLAAGDVPYVFLESGLNFHSGQEAGIRHGRSP